MSRRRDVVRFALVVVLALFSHLGPAQPTDAADLEERLISARLEIDSDVIYERSRQLFDYDPSASFEVAEHGRWEQDGITFIDLTYASPKGGRVPATLVVPPGPGPFAGLIIQHGMPSGRQAEYAVAEIYAGLGAVVLAIDAPFARPENTWRAPVLFTEQDRAEQIQLIVDLRRGIDLLIARPDVDRDRLAYIGVSYGGAMGGLLAGVETRLRAYALVVGDGGLVIHHLVVPEGFRTPLDGMTEEA